MSGREPIAVLVRVRRAMFDDMCWPMPPDQAMYDRINYTAPDEPLSQDDRSYVTAVLSAYMQLIDLPARERNRRIRGLREAIKIDAAENGKEKS